MGWDATAFEKVYDGDGKGSKFDREVLDAFREAAENVIEIVGAADIMLEHGGLHLWECMHMLESVSGISAYDTIWTAEQVREINEYADWEFEISEDQESAYWSVLRFLEVCAKYGLGIVFH